MTVRPRSTPGMKARELRALAGLVAPNVQMILSATAPHAALLVAVLFNGTRDILTRRYTDPKDPR